MSNRRKEVLGLDNQLSHVLLAIREGASLHDPVHHPLMIRHIVVPFNMVSHTGGTEVQARGEIIHYFPRQDMVSTNAWWPGRPSQPQLPMIRGFNPR